MGVLSCPYRGERIPNLRVKSNPTNVCNHPAVRRPCVVAKSDGMVASCLHCRFWKDSPEVAAAKLAGIPSLNPETFALPKPPLPPERRDRLPDCQFLGGYTGQTVACPTGCKAKFKVYECSLHGTCTLADAGQGVTACCQTCPDKTPTPARNVNWLIVPPAPRLELQPVLKRAVVTIAAGAEAEALHAISGPLMAAYADRIGADFRVLDWPGHPLWPMSSKYAIPRALDDHLYERIVYLDADVLVPPGAVDLLKLCEPDEFGAFDELPFIRRQPQFHQEASAQQYRDAMKFPRVETLPFYFNCGVMVASRQHRDYLEAPTAPMPIGHCSEQHHTNAVLLDAYLAGLTKIKALDRRANWQNWTPDFDQAPPDALRHYSSGGPRRKRRIADMREAAAAFTKE